MRKKSATSFDVFQQFTIMEMWSSIFISMEDTCMNSIGKLVSPLSKERKQKCSVFISMLCLNEKQ